MANEYINNSKFEEAVDKFRQAKQNREKSIAEFKQAETELTELFYLLADNIIRAFKFQLVDREDALQEGVMICFEKLHRFDPAKGRLFNFSTTVILNHFRQLYRTAKSYNEFKKRYHDHLITKVEEIFMNSMSGKAKFRKKPSEDM